MNNDIFELKEIFDTLKLGNRAYPADGWKPDLSPLTAGIIPPIAIRQYGARHGTLEGPVCATPGCGSILTSADRWSTCQQCVREGK